MKRFSIIVLASAAWICSGCYSASLQSAPYTTAVYTEPQPATKIIPASHDISMDLDLQAVAWALARATSVRDFEIILNDCSKGVSNLDLNEDGCVDYIRVMETYRQDVYVLLLQAVLGPDQYQDMASIVIERPYYSDWHIEIIGEPYIYGRDYCVLPLYESSPLILNCFKSNRHSGCWSSPWHWGFYAPFYKKEAPLYYSVYRQNVAGFSQSGCRGLVYPETRHCQDYESISRSARRDDYSRTHADKSFSSRTADQTPKSPDLPGSVSGKIRNASDLRRMEDARNDVQPVPGKSLSDGMSQDSNGASHERLRHESGRTYDRQPGHVESSNYRNGSSSHTSGRNTSGNGSAKSSRPYTNVPSIQGRSDRTSYDTGTPSHSSGNSRQSGHSGNSGVSKHSGSSGTGHSSGSGSVHRSSSVQSSSRASRKRQL